ncbi:hypothetical protein K8R43_03795 [archaeon]|nr:hypothetical protein [archaeon]
MSEEDQVLGNLVRAVRMLEKSPTFWKVIPEVRTNIAYALPHAITPKKVAAIQGRITIIDEQAKAAGYPAFGASNHIARRLIALIKTDPNKRAAMDIKYNKQIEQFISDYCNVKSLTAVKIDRSKEPEEIKNEENSSMFWIADQMVEKAYDKVPDISIETGGEGKEPVIVLIAEDAVKVAQMAIDISEFVKDSHEIKPIFPKETTPAKQVTPIEPATPIEPLKTKPVETKPEESKEDKDLDDFSWDEEPAKKKEEEKIPEMKEKASVEVAKEKEDDDMWSDFNKKDSWKAKPKKKEKADDDDEAFDWG